MAVRVFENPMSFSATVTYDEAANRVSGAILNEIVDGISAKFIQDHAETIIADLDTTTITKLVAERVAARLVEKMIGVLGGGKP